MAILPIFSVLYLFLLADLLCSAAAIPVFYGLFNRRHDGVTATVATLCGLVAGLTLFPGPNEKPVYLLESFLAAGIVPVVVMLLMPYLRPRRQPFDFARLNASIRKLDDPPVR